ncbi:MAG TPA: (Fe-S)-binding protein [Pyrinomonadaceae bacterium]|nr:(Fe-S)-binding protein [Pyrinomonadaceae bacterium]
MKVSIFITCIVDQMYPRVGMAMAELLARLGVEVVFNPAQTCCGQPAFNAGYRAQARDVAAQMLDIFERELESADYVVAPSGSCTSMVKNFYPELFADSPRMLSRVARVAARTFELSQFIVDVLGVEDVGSEFKGRLTYHDSCHLLRELGVDSAPRKLLSKVRGVEFVESDRADACCGFGGVFSVKFPETSAAIGAEKITSIERSRADAVVSCDAGCMMQMAGLLGRKGSPVRCLHLAEVLAPPA